MRHPILPALDRNLYHLALQRLVLARPRIARPKDHLAELHLASGINLHDTLPSSHPGANQRFRERIRLQSISSLGQHALLARCRQVTVWTWIWEILLRVAHFANKCSSDARSYGLGILMGCRGCLRVGCNKRHWE